MPEHVNITNLFSNARAAYSSKENGVDPCLRSIDFHLRALGLLAAKYLVARQRPLLLHPCPGLGSLVAYLKSSLSENGIVRGGTLAHCIDATLRGVTTTLPGQTTPNIELLRNHLFHGGTIPGGGPGARLHEAVLRMEDEISQAFAELLRGSRISSVGNDPYDAALTIDNTTTQLWPLILAPPEGIQILGRFTSKGAQYLCPGSPTPRRLETSEKTTNAIRALVRFEEHDRAIADLVEWVKDDLSGFANPDHATHFTDNDGIVTFFWVRQAPDADEHRSDAFRLGQDDQRQWRRDSPDNWVPYSEFLKFLSMWPNLAVRLRQQFGSHPCLTSISTTVAPKISMRNMDFSSANPTAQSDQTAQKFLTASDDALSRNRGQTLIVFLAGEAGIGKTSCLVKAAFDRARELERDPQCSLPLYLYVSSTGNVLAQLENVVQAAVAPTRNLTKEGVLALCRSGLMVLLIDGFDELVGGSTYSDAVGSLRPWMEALGGRGVMIVSARSSYYLQQYRRSIAQSTSRGVAANHVIAQLQRWSDFEVECYLTEQDVPARVWKNLPQGQRDLLRIPFYSSELAKWWRSGASKRDAPGDLQRLMIDRFLSREVDKLRIPGANAPLLSHDEFRVVCMNLAEMMAGNEDREVGLQDLEYAVSLAIDDDLSKRRGLRDRLTVLCGLGVRGETDPRYTFDHELYFDCFLGDALVRYLTEKSFPAAEKIFDKTLLRDATFDIITSNTKRIFQVLKSASLPNTDVCRHNYGQVWGRLMAQGVAPSLPLASLRFGELDLTMVRQPIHLIHCVVQELAVDVPGVFAHTIEGCSVERLVVRKSSVGSIHTKLVLTETNIRAIQTPAVYEDTPQGVLRALADFDLVPAQQGQSPGNTEAFEFFLDRISSRAEISVVIRATDRRTEDHRLHWTEVYGVDVWQSFVRTLINCNIAELLAFPGSGDAKRRLHFLIGARDVLNRDGGNVNVAQFWTRASS